MNVTRAILPVMRSQRSGNIFTVSSVAGLFSVAGGAVYASSKFAVEGLMEGLAQEVKPLGIHSTIIEPGFFKTDFLDSSSVKYGELNLADYAETVAKFKDWHDNMNHQQAGDPERLGQVLIELSELDNPPVRFAAGSDAFNVVTEKAKDLKENAEAYMALSKSTDFESAASVSSLNEIGK